MEIEAMINARPLTCLPLDSPESEAFTPNHFIHLVSNACRPIGNFSDDVKVLRYNWKMAQHSTICKSLLETMDSGVPPRDHEK